MKQIDSNTLTYIVYSHTDYINILNVQSDYIAKCPNRTLFVNQPIGSELEQISKRYDDVVYYDDTQLYTDRVAQCLESITTEYVLFTHDIDILLDVDLAVIDQLHDLAKLNNIDRIDLKHTPLAMHESVDDSNVVLLKHDDVNRYIYNVNPSIWRVSAFKELLAAFKNRSYRNVEDMDVQQFCTKYNIYRAYSKDYLKCGYYNCMSFYKFLHISHSGKLLTPNERMVTEYGQSYEDVSVDLEKIISVYNLR